MKGDSRPRGPTHGLRTALGRDRATDNRKQHRWGHLGRYMMCPHARSGQEDPDRLRRDPGGCPHGRPLPLGRGGHHTRWRTRRVGRRGRGGGLDRRGPTPVGPGTDDRPREPQDLDRPRLLVPGEPASGKSHLATTLAQRLARRDRERHALVLDLGVWNPEANEDVVLHTARTARRGLHPGTDPPPEPELHTLIHQGRVLVVLDGLDRVRPVWRPTALAVIEDFGAALADAYARLGRVRRLRHLAEVGRVEEAIDPLRGRGHPGGRARRRDHPAAVGPPPFSCQVPHLTGRTGRVRPGRAGSPRSGWWVGRSTWRADPARPTAHPHGCRCRYRRRTPWWPHPGPLR